MSRSGKCPTGSLSSNRAAAIRGGSTLTYTILIIEDDSKIAAGISDYLARYGYRTALVQDFARVEEEFLQSNPHLVLMDVNLPYRDGFHLTRDLRRHSSVPILFVSARSGDMEQVLGMESGGDDYITKPVNLEVLHAKIKAMLRRAYGEYATPETQSRALVRVGALELDLTAAELRWVGEAQPLTRNELRLLHLLMERADRVVSRDACLEALWDDTAFVDDNTLTVNVNRVRAKLDQWGLKEALETRRGLGYLLARSRLEVEP